MVIFKDQNNFAQAHSQWVLSNDSFVNRMFVGKRSPLNVQESLSHLQSIVVDTNDEALVSAMANGNVVVEKEIFHKPPTPVKNFDSTQPWFFNVQYEVDSSILKKRFKNPPKSAVDTAPTEEVVIYKENTPWGIKAVKAREAWSLSRRGQGARVLVLDTGIDKDHPALKTQIEATRDFVGDNQAPYDVADKVGHGTHVAGTVAAAEAADGFVGVAPNAKVLAGRVCNDQGCSNIDVARGINWGIEQKVDVINLSLGSDFGSQAEQSAIAKAERAGVVVVAASGNDGKPSVGYPAAYPTVLAVGATDVNSKKADFSQWGPQLAVVAPGVDIMSSVPGGSGCQATATLTDVSATAEVNSTCFSGSAFISAGLKKELVFTGLGKTEDFTGKDLTDKFALISRGEITFADKVKNALAANAAGVVIYNNTAGLMSGSLTEDGSLLAIPVVMIEQVVGDKLKVQLAEGKTASIEVKTVSTDYSAFSGTSMASPHAAGVAALVRAVKKSLTPAQVREILKSTTTKLGPNDQNQYGAGLIDAEKAVTKASQVQ